MKTRSRESYPFPFFGQGSARADELAPLVVFGAKVPHAQMARLAARAPDSLQHGVRIGARWLWLQSDERYVIGDKAYKAVAAALERWILEVHREHPVALFFVPSEQGGGIRHGPWHDWSVAHYDDRVRALMTELRAGGDGEHAEWISRNFFAAGAMPTAHEVQQLADADPPDELGARHKRCVLIIRLLRRDGRKVLAHIGAFAELTFWACAATNEYLDNPEGFPAYVQQLLHACEDAHSPSELQELIVDVATRMLRNELPLAVALAFPAKSAPGAPTAPAVVAAQNLLIAYFQSGGPATPAAITNLLFTLGEPGCFDAARHGALLEKMLAVAEHDHALLDASLVENLIRALNNSGRGAESLRWIAIAEARKLDLGPEPYLNMTWGAYLSQDTDAMARAAAHIECLAEGDRVMSLAAAGVFDNTAALYVALGNKQRALECIALCKKHRYPAFAKMPQMSEYASLKDDPEFKRIFK